VKEQKRLFKTTLREAEDRYCIERGIIFGTDDMIWMIGGRMSPGGVYDLLTSEAGRLFASFRSE
jgi:hypothetical protein